MAAAESVPPSARKGSSNARRSACSAAAVESPVRRSSSGGLSEAKPTTWTPVRTEMSFSASTSTLRGVPSAIEV